jgi:hypothetical protein
MTSEELYNTQNAFCVLPNANWSCELLLGLMNSRLLAFYHRKRYLEEFKMRFQKVLIKDWRRLPIPVSLQTDRRSRELGEEIASGAAKITELRDHLHGCRVPIEEQTVEREIHALDRRIDSLVYKLYGLSADEVAVVDASFAREPTRPTDPTVV